MKGDPYFSRYLTPLLPLATEAIPKGRPLNRINCVLFDIYGTLFISGSGDIGVLKNSGHKKEDLEKLIKRFNCPMSAAALKQSLIAKIKEEHMRLNHLGIDHPEVVNEKIWQSILGTEDLEKAKQFAVEYELISNPIWPMPGLENTLNDLRKKKIEMGIISNAQFYTPYLFGWFLKKNPEALGFNPSYLFYSYITGQAKPSGHMFELAEKQLKKNEITAASTLYVGNDMLNDIYPAKASGFKTALFAGDMRSLRTREDHPLCKDLSPDIVLTHLNQLAPLLKRQ